jgi:hypothetical protein
VDCRIVLTDVDVHLERLFLQESNIKVINLIFETELGLVVGFQAFTHLGCLSGMVVEVDSAQGDQGSMGSLGNFGQVRDRLHYVLVKLGIFDLEVHNVFILAAFGLVCHSTELGLGIVVVGTSAADGASSLGWHDTSL